MGSEVLSEASQPGGGIEARVAGVEEVAWGVVDVDEDRVVLAWSAGPEHRRVVVDEGEAHLKVVAFLEGLKVI